MKFSESIDKAIQILTDKYKLNISCDEDSVEIEDENWSFEYEIEDWNVYGACFDGKPNIQNIVDVIEGDIIRRFNKELIL